MRNYGVCEIQSDRAEFYAEMCSLDSDGRLSQMKPVLQQTRNREKDLVLNDS